MSLYKQLWLAILFLMFLAFSGSFIVSSMSAKNYLEQQLSLKNIDNANSLALAIANTATDDVTTELMIAAQFDTGHYQYIRLVDINSNIKVEHIDNNNSSSVPEWFSQLLKITAHEGVAQIQHGWQQIGTLTLKSHDTFAYHTLWESSVRLFNYCLGIALIGGLIGTVLLKFILRPLTATVNQAESISKRQFVVVKEPRTKEFRDVVKSMNSLSLRIKTMLEEESARLSRLQKGALFDEVTSLPNREHFLNILGANLDADESGSSGILVIIRLQNLAELNRIHGRQLMDLLLSRIGISLLEQTNKENGWQVGRLDGSDFALLATEEHEPLLIAQKAQLVLLAVINEMEILNDTDLPTAASIYHPGEDLSMLLDKIDAVLVSAEHKGDCAIEIADEKTLGQDKVSVDQWQLLLDNAFKTNGFSLAKFPVINNKNSLLHHECPARLTTSEGSVMNGGQFIPWINRFEMGISLDEKIIDLALKELQSPGIDLCINLSAQALNNNRFLSSLVDKLSARPNQAHRLWMEITEHSAYQNLAGFKRFCRAIKPLGCYIGIEHVGHQISQIGEIHDLGLDYIKVDASISRQIESTPAHQILLRGLCTIVHSIGVVAIAEGVQGKTQWKMLQELGVDGATGPMVTELLKNTQ